jgi:hypothetical protein
MRRLALAAALLPLCSCSYGPVTASHRFTNAMPEPGGHRFAVVLLTTESREPRGFLSRFPDGGRPKILSEKMALWLCDADRGTAARVATLPKPADTSSDFSAWIVGWDPPGESSGVYVEVSGRRGETSDSRFLRWLLRIGVGLDPGVGTAVTFLPNEAARPPAQGPLRGGRELQVSLGADTIAVRADTRPEWAPLFRAEPRTGEVALLPGAAPLGAAVEPRVARAPEDPPAHGLSSLRPRALASVGPRAAPAIWCDSVQLFLRHYAASPMERGSEPYEDPLSARPLPACSIRLTEAWSSVDPLRPPWDALGAWLTAHGFVRDNRYGEEDANGASGLYRRGDRFCAYAASWWTDRPAAGEKIGGSGKEPPTRYRLSAWSGVAR